MRIPPHDYNMFASRDLEIRLKVMVCLIPKDVI